MKIVGPRPSGATRCAAADAALAGHFSSPPRSQHAGRSRTLRSRTIKRQALPPEQVVGCTVNASKPADATSSFGGTVGHVAFLQSLAMLFCRRFAQAFSCAELRRTGKARSLSSQLSSPRWPSAGRGCCSMTVQVIAKSTATCPFCQRPKLDDAANACQFFYDCTGCGAILRRPGDCCISLARSEPFRARQFKKQVGRVLAADQRNCCFTLVPRPMGPCRRVSAVFFCSSLGQRREERRCLDGPHCLSIAAIIFSMWSDVRGRFRYALTDGPCISVIRGRSRAMLLRSVPLRRLTVGLSSSSVLEERFGPPRAGHVHHRRLLHHRRKQSVLPSRRPGSLGFEP